MVVNILPSNVGSERGPGNICRLEQEDEAKVIYTIIGTAAIPGTQNLGIFPPAHYNIK